MKGSVLYVDGKKLGTWTKGWRGQVVQVLNRKSGGATNGAKNLMLLSRLEEEWTPIVLKTWASNTISGILDDKVRGDQLQMGTIDPIKDKVCWQGKKTVIHWGIFPVGGKFESWVIAPNVLLESGYLSSHILKKGEVPSMELPGRYMDADERGTDGVNMEIVVSDAPCHYNAGNFGGSPTDWN